MIRARAVIRDRLIRHTQDTLRGLRAFVSCWHSDELELLGLLSEPTRLREVEASIVDHTLKCLETPTGIEPLSRFSRTKRAVAKKSKRLRGSPTPRQIARGETETIAPDEAADVR